ncbi:MAG: diadenylate cyclase CdaA [Oscillospiraceae bacterium]|nr:diadenylate cyclase CdaA [Oscillospiraceae bacterium]
MDWLPEIAGFVWDYARTIGPADVLDIAVVAFFIYKMVSYFSRTGSGRVMRGVLLLLGLMWLAASLRMTVVNVLIGETFKIGILAIIVLFQPEFRHFLERLGSSDLSQVFSTARKVGAKEYDAIIDAITAAAAEFSKSSTGALIVFERKMKLDDIVKSGSELDASVNKELIKNIFYPKTPLHDGAAIIRNGRISAAACMLPLSQNPNIDRNLGTRHRAAIGISELTDAVVVVVSEETGAISVATGGMLKRRLAPDILQSLLRSELIADDVASNTVISKIRSAAKKTTDKEEV